MHWILTFIIVVGIITGLISGVGTLIEMMGWILLLPIKMVMFVLHLFI